MFPTFLQNNKIYIRKTGRGGGWKRSNASEDDKAAEEIDGPTANVGPKVAFSDPEIFTLCSDSNGGHLTVKFSTGKPSRPLAARYTVA